jgi:hypothetical protein
MPTSWKKTEFNANIAQPLTLTCVPPCLFAARSLLVPLHFSLPPSEDPTGSDMEILSRERISVMGSSMGALTGSLARGCSGAPVKD